MAVDDQEAERLCAVCVDGLARWRLATPGAILIASLAPFHRIIAVGMRFAEPFLDVLWPTGEYRVWTRTMASPHGAHHLHQAAQRVLQPEFNHRRREP